MYKSGVELGKTSVYILNTVEWIWFGTQFKKAKIFIETFFKMFGWMDIQR